jgi:hypothetical protein
MNNEYQRHTMWKATPGIIGGFTVAGVLCYGLYTFAVPSKDIMAANRAMKWRVGMQAGVVGALFSYYALTQSPLGKYLGFGQARVEFNPVPIFANQKLY